jgi:hypothetical protein
MRKVPRKASTSKASTQSGSNPARAAKGKDRVTRVNPAPRSGPPAPPVSEAPTPTVVTTARVSAGPVERLSEELAAFRLGHLGRTIWVWHRLFWSRPELELVEDGVPFSVSQLRDARLALAREIHTNVFLGLDRVLDDWDRLAARLYKAWEETGTYGPTPFGSDVVPGSGHWQELRVLADSALPPSHRLRPVYDLGRLLGDYQVELFDYQPNLGAADELERLPDVRPLVRQIGFLPKAYLDGLPLFRSVVDLAPLLDQGGQSTFLAALFKKHEGLWGQRFPRVDYSAVDRMMLVLARRAEAGLGSIEPPESVGAGQGATADGIVTAPPQPGSDPVGGTVPVQTRSELKPHWDKARGRLYYGDQEAKRVIKLAVNVLKVLDAFQACGWKYEIADPLADPHAKKKDAQRLHETVKSLNKKLRYIKFRADGSGTGFRWEPVAPTTP